MPVNRNALIRYKTIDKCLQNRFRKWTLDDLIDACSDALYEYEGIDKGISKRTIQSDLQMMRSDKLGYNAPIIVLEKKYYTYEEGDYSITNIPLTDQDLHQLGEAVSFLKQFRGFSHFRKLEGMIQKLEDHIHSKQDNRSTIIDFETNDLLRGIYYLEELYQAILKEKCVELQYKSYKAREVSTFIFHPFLLKEFNNRWFVLGKRAKNKMVMVLALDRIEGLCISDEILSPIKNFIPSDYFNDIIGVTNNFNDEAQEILLQANRKHAPYILTKPLHASQKEVERNHEGVVISLKVKFNYELEQAILAYGENIKVIKPQYLKRKILSRLNASIENYQQDLSIKALMIEKTKILKSGFTKFNSFYLQSELQELKVMLRNFLNLNKESLENDYTDLNPIITDYPKFSSTLLKSELKKFVSLIDPDLVFRQASLVNLSKKNDSICDWHQDEKYYFGERKKTGDLKSWKKIAGGYIAEPSDEALGNGLSLYIFLKASNEKTGSWEFLSGSHKRKHKQKDIVMIAENCTSSATDFNAGSMVVFRPLILKKFNKGPETSKLLLIELNFEISDK